MHELPTSLRKHLRHNNLTYYLPTTHYLLHARMRACVHLHMGQICATLVILTPRCGGDSIRAQTWSRCGLPCVRFLFGIEQEANRRKLLMCVNHQLRNQKWQEHLRVRASTSCARACVYVNTCCVLMPTQFVPERT